MWLVLQWEQCDGEALCKMHRITDLSLCEEVDITFAFHNSKVWRVERWRWKCMNLPDLLYNFPSTAVDTHAPNKWAGHKLNKLSTTFGHYYCLIIPQYPCKNQWEYLLILDNLVIFWGADVFASYINSNNCIGLEGYEKACNQRLMFCWIANVLSFRWRPMHIVIGPFNFWFDLSLMVSLISWIRLQAHKRMAYWRNFSKCTLLKTNEVICSGFNCEVAYFCIISYVILQGSQKLGSPRAEPREDA